MVTRWIFEDPTDASTYTVPINPNTGGTPGRRKTMQFTNTAGPNGRVLAFEGREQVQELEISGTILEQAHLDALTTWYEKRYQVAVTDDLGRRYVIYITDFLPTRRRSATYPYKHDFTMRYFILDWS